MIARFLLMWLFFSSLAGTWLFVMGRNEKVVTKTIVRRSAISAAIGALIVACLYLVNNIQGV